MNEKDRQEITRQIFSPKLLREKKPGEEAETGSFGKNQEPREETYNRDFGDDSLLLENKKKDDRGKRGKSRKAKTKMERDEY